MIKLLKQKIDEKCKATILKWSCHNIDISVLRQATHNVSLDLKHCRVVATLVVVPRSALKSSKHVSQVLEKITIFSKFLSSKKFFHILVCAVNKVKPFIYTKRVKFSNHFVIRYSNNEQDLSDFHFMRNTFL